MVTRSTLLYTTIALAIIIAVSAGYVYLGVLGNRDKGFEISNYGSILRFNDTVVESFELNSTEGLITFPIPGKINVVTPQYLSCPDICPLESIMLKYVMAKVVQAGWQDRIVFVTVNVDPWRDTPEKARNYINAYASDLIAKGAKWIWVVDTPEKMKKVWDSLNIYVEKDPETGLVTHTGGFFIISPGGKLLYYLSPSSLGWSEPDKFAELLWDTLKRVAERGGQP